MLILSRGKGEHRVRPYAKRCLGRGELHVRPDSASIQKQDSRVSKDLPVETWTSEILDQVGFSL
jgi:hypothetical protein